VLAVAGGSAVAWSTPAQAGPGPFVVTTNSDSGPGSLRAALAAAANAASDDTVTFDPTVTGTITLSSGELDTTVGGTSGNVVIDGPGNLTVDAGHLSRVLSVVGSGGAVRPTATVSGLTLTGGATPLNNPEDGGAVRATGADLALDGVVVSDSRSGKSGGGVSVAGGSLTLLSSAITGNTTTTDQDFSTLTPDDGGGGLSVDANGAAGVGLAVTDSTVSGNTTSGRGGGVRAVGGASATITRSTVSGNRATHTFRGVEVAAVVGLGGGIAAPDLTVVDSSITGNEAGSKGGGVAGRSLVATGTTIADNVAGQAGGGLAVDGSTAGAHLDVTSSTVSGNRADLGGGAYTEAVVPIRLTTSTVTANPAVTGGGLYSTTMDLTAKGSIVAMNTGGDLAGAGNATLTRSLVQEPRGVTYVDAGGSVTGADPLLGPLADNGGPTWTTLPAPNSPVIDQGDAFGATTDQRGSARATDISSVPNAADGSDMGAVELTQTEDSNGLPQVAVTARPTITGTTRVGQTLHTDGGTWAPAGVTKSYQWLRGSLPIPGATQASYTLTPADWGQNWYGDDQRIRLSVRVTASASGYRDSSAVLSDSNAFVGLGDLRVSRPPSLTGRLRVGSTVHAWARLGSISPRPATVFYQWFVHGRWLTRARSSSLVLKPWMRGKRVRVVFGYAAVPGYHRLIQEARGRHPIR
jgi:hypothetical protein